MTLHQTLIRMTALPCAGCTWCGGTCYVTDPDGVRWPCIECCPGGHR